MCKAEQRSSDCAPISVVTESVGRVVAPSCRASQHAAAPNAQANSKIFSSASKDPFVELNKTFPYFVSEQHGSNVTAQPPSATISIRSESAAVICRSSIR